MKATKKMASTAKKRATIIAMAAIAGTSVQQAEAARLAAFADMKADGFVINYTYNPFEGMYA